MDTLSIQPARPLTERREAICDAVFELLSEVGYDHMSMDAVAARARASKATIYRSWPNKPDLVMEALVYRYASTPEPADTGTLRGDLMAQMRTAVALANGPDGDVLAGLMTAATRNPELSRTLHRCMYETRHTMHQTITARALARGEISPDVDPDLLHEVMHSMVLTRKLWGAAPLDEAFATHVVDDILLPVLTRTNK